MSRSDVDTSLGPLSSSRYQNKLLNLLLHIPRIMLGARVWLVPHHSQPGLVPPTTLATSSMYHVLLHRDLLRAATRNAASATPTAMPYIVLLRAIVHGIWRLAPAATEQPFRLAWRPSPPNTNGNNNNASDIARPEPTDACWQAITQAHLCSGLAAAWRHDQDVQFLFQLHIRSSLSPPRVTYTPCLHALNVNVVTSMAGPSLHDCLAPALAPRDTAAMQRKCQLVALWWNMYAPYASLMYPLSSGLWLLRHLRRLQPSWRDLLAAVNLDTLLQWLHALWMLQSLPATYLANVQCSASECSLPWDSVLWPLWLAVVHHPSLHAPHQLSAVNRARFMEVLFGSIEPFPRYNHVTCDGCLRGGDLYVKHGARDVDDVLWALARLHEPDSLRASAGVWSLTYMHAEVPCATAGVQGDASLHAAAWDAVLTAWGCSSSLQPIAAPPRSGLPFARQARFLKNVPHPGLLLRVVHSLRCRSTASLARSAPHLTACLQAWCRHSDAPLTAEYHLLLRKVYTLVARHAAAARIIEVAGRSASATLQPTAVIDLTDSDDSRNVPSSAAPAVERATCRHRIPAPPRSSSTGSSNTDSSSSDDSSSSSSSEDSDCDETPSTVLSTAFSANYTVGTVAAHNTLVQSFLVLLRPRSQGSIAALRAWLKCSRYQAGFQGPAISHHSQVRRRAMFLLATSLVYKRFPLTLTTTSPEPTPSASLCLHAVLRSRFGTVMYRDRATWRTLLRRWQGFLGVPPPRYNDNGATTTLPTREDLAACDNAFVLATIVNLTVARPVAAAKRPTSAIMLAPWSELNVSCIWVTSCGCEFTPIEFLRCMKRQATFVAPTARDTGAFPVTPIPDSAGDTLPLPPIGVWDRECPACSAGMKPLNIHHRPIDPA